MRETVVKRRQPASAAPPDAEPDGWCRPAPRRTAGLFAMLLSSLLLLAAQAALADYPDVPCLGCHGGRPRPFIDPRTGARRDIGIDIRRRSISAHGALRCRECHVGAFVIFPHPRDRRTRRCLDCHPRRGEKVDAGYAFPGIAREFEASAHGRIDGFVCEDCHDPHGFRTTRALSSAASRLVAHNAPCRSCHRRDARGPKSDPAKAGLVALHADIPQAERHLARSRCVDCHDLAPERTVSHALPAAARTPRDCVSCHRRNGTTLHRFLRGIDPPASDPGFTEPLLLRHAYVMAATRPRALDRLFLLGAGALILLAGAHGLQRLRRRRRSPTGRGSSRRPVAIRLWHAATLLLFLALAVSGLELHFAAPGLEPLRYDFATRMHEIAGAGLAALWLVHLVWLAASGEARRYRPPAPWEAWAEIRAYARAMAAGLPPPKAEGTALGALQRGAYGLVLFLLLPLLTASGILYLAPARLPEKIAGYAGLWPVALLHTAAAFLALLFLLLHLFMLCASGEARLLLRAIFAPGEDAGAPPWRQGRSRPEGSGSCASQARISR